MVKYADVSLGRLVEQGVQQQLPGGGAEAGVQLEAAQGEVTQRRGQRGRHLGGAGGTRDLGEERVKQSIIVIEISHPKY